MKTNRSGRGFTLIETLIILAIMMALAAFTLPEFFAIMNRSKLEGAARQTATLMRAARLEAIKQSCYGVVMIEPVDTDMIMGFVDNDRDGLYEPDNVPPERMIGRVQLPARIHFSSIKDLDNPSVPLPLPDGQVMYQQDGSVLATGAVRFEDEKGNQLEVNVEPRTTGRVEVRKLQDGVWITNGEGGKAWKFIK